MKNLFNTVKVILGAAAAVYFTKSDASKRAVMTAFVEYKNFSKEFKALDLTKLSVRRLLEELDDWVVVEEAYAKGEKRNAEKLHPFDTFNSVERALVAGATTTQLIAARANVQSILNELKTRY